MDRSSAATQLRIYVNDSDRSGGRPLALEIVARLAREGIAGATMLHGIEGFGRRGIVHSERIVDADGGLPLVIEIVDSATRIESVMTWLAPLIGSGLVTRERLQAIARGRAADRNAPA